MQSSLTRKERREAEAAIYGLAVQPMNQQLSPDDIERMRAILAQHDAQNGGQRIQKEFDLNNPPRQPYRHQDYPRVMYHHDERRMVKVRDAREEKAHIEQGFSAEPFPADMPAAPEMDSADAAEVARLDKIARRPKKQPE